MRKSPGRSRTASRLSASLDQRLNFYALAASAAGVGLLALAQPSEAKIIYTKTHQVISPNGIYPLDLNHDGTIDFLIQERFQPNTGCGGYSGLWAKEAFGNAVEGNGGWASALSKGAPIGPQQGFISSKGSFGEVMVHFWSSPCGGGSQGQWANLKNRYLGLKFRIDGKVHYGWARLSVEVGSGKIVTTLTGYAYETIPNKAICAGQTHGATESDTATPDVRMPAASGLAANVEPTPRPAQSASLGALALGAGHASSWRRP
jgi:hypothetical protein